MKDPIGTPCRESSPAGTKAPEFPLSRHLLLLRAAQLDAMVEAAGMRPRVVTHQGGAFNERVASIFTEPGDNPGQYCTGRTFSTDSVERGVTLPRANLLASAPVLATELAVALREIAVLRRAGCRAQIIENAVRNGRSKREQVVTDEQDEVSDVG